ncbi:hypothetical protein SAMN05444920_10739 [Nonomuraea solani]|uniref:Uncharacterized protein n=1 Tax=Nonomuraea solani TaxID=1144553 RepID=A0A1H6DZF5_9ACTN|nr:hypothetical protein [Nonomuraea solani]SEG90479.1 hypothetical protein SAMN05444920_10739 [Nonomuraea solani]
MNLSEPATESAGPRIDAMNAAGATVPGAGTPGRLGALDASQCPPAFSTPPEQVFAIVSPREDDEEAGRA